jgi:hypothetical protein
MYWRCSNGAGRRVGGRGAAERQLGGHLTRARLKAALVQVPIALWREAQSLGLLDAALPLPA